MPFDQSLTLDQCIALFSALLSFAGWLLVVWQLRDGNAQRRLESLLQISSVNREIVALGFDHPELFQILHGKKADPILEQHYLQLWLNQFKVIHGFKERQALPQDLLDGLTRDIRDFMAQPNMHRHWISTRQFYPASFQSFVDEIANEKAGGSSERPPRKRRFKR